MNKKNAFGTIRRHPGRALAVCVPLAAVAVFAGTTMASAQPEATLAVSPSASSVSPAPFVPYFGSSTAGNTHVVKKQRDIPVKEPANIDGCDHDYGTGNQCVPWQIPASSPQAACAWLRANGFGPLKVYGTNRQHLPENSAGYVCATGTG